MKNYPILLIIVVAGLCGCKQGRPDTVSLTLELPDTSRSESGIFSYLHKNRLNDELNLHRLEQGIDSFELRFDTHASILKFGQLLVFKKERNKEWTCLEYLYIIKHIPFGSTQNILDFATTFTIDTILVYKHEPVNGWKNLFTALEKENIYSLPDQEDIPSWDGLGNTFADGVLYSVEFVHQNRYKFYTYTSPQDLGKDFKECRSMTNIINILDREIGVKDNLNEITSAWNMIRHVRRKMPEPSE